MLFVLAPLSGTEDLSSLGYLISVLSIVPQQIEQRVSFFESDSKKI